MFKIWRDLKNKIQPPYSNIIFSNMASYICHLKINNVQNMARFNNVKHPPYLNIILSNIESYVLPSKNK